MRLLGLAREIKLPRADARIKLVSDTPAHAETATAGDLGDTAVAAVAGVQTEPVKSEAVSA
jgi:hypothetical protein